MKLMTLNTHSLVEEDYEKKLIAFVDAVVQERPHVIALQEVNQSIGGERISPFDRYCPAEDVCIKADNHANSVARLLDESGVAYHWTWIPVKEGYGRYDEGVALFSLSKIIAAEAVTVSLTDDYKDWKRRRILGVCCEAAEDVWFYSVHYGWWNDCADPFYRQWEKTVAHLKERNKVWLMGDFNNPAENRGEGYDSIIDCGWQDSYSAAQRRDGARTVAKCIDGWKDNHPNNGIRIDQIWSNYRIGIRESRVVFDGERYPVVSDHFGVIAETEKSI